MLLDAESIDRVAKRFTDRTNKRRIEITLDTVRDVCEAIDQRSDDTQYRAAINNAGGESLQKKQRNQLISMVNLERGLQEVFD